MEMTMHIDYLNIPNQNDARTNTKPYWNLDKYNNEEYKWEDVFQDDNLVHTISKSLVIFDGVKVTSTTKHLELDNFILIYVPYILEKGICDSTSRLSNA